MCHKNMIRIFLPVFLLFTIAFLSQAEEDVPPMPPAKFAGEVYLNGKLLTGGQYSLTAFKGRKKVNGTVDSAGRYTLSIPDGKGLEPGDTLKVNLYRKKRLVSSERLTLHDFGYMQIQPLSFKKRTF
jgi:hypothetical protein